MMSVYSKTIAVTAALIMAVSVTEMRGSPVSNTVSAQSLPVYMAQPKPVLLTGSALYHKPKKIKLSASEFQCLAKNIYYEAGIEDRAGKIAVAQVTWNRVQNGTWGKTVCKVVYAPRQFSWTHENKPAPRGTLWHQSQQAARDFLDGVRVTGLDHSKYYHATWISAPAWTEAMQFTTVIGQHIFYTHVR